jgi:ABC-type branched-subunit amino acid transport system substrate-binding protein
MMKKTRPRVAVVVPSDSVIAEEFKQGVRLYIDNINHNAQQEGRKIN